MLAYMQFPEWIQPEVIPGLPLLRWYGLMYILAFGTAYAMFIVQVKKDKLKIESDDVMSFFLWAIVGLLIGARVFATLFFDASGFYLRNPHLILLPFDENWNFVGFRGMNYYGGVAGAIVGMYLYTKMNKINLLEWGDMLAVAIPLGYTFGRLGNFINQELYGRITAAATGIIFPRAQPVPVDNPYVQEVAADAGIELPASGLFNMPRHPTQIYEALLEGPLLFLVMWFVFRTRKPFHGFLIGIYIIGYGFVRFWVDYLRMPLHGDFALELSSVDNPPYVFQSMLDFIASQFWALGMVAGGALFIIVLAQMYKRNMIVDPSVPATAKVTDQKSDRSSSEARRRRKKLRGK